MTVPGNEDDGYPGWVLRWGEQFDIRPIGAFGTGELTEQAVASYVAKYATKAAETTGTVDRRIGELDKLPDLPDHTRRLSRLLGPGRVLPGPQALAVGPHARLPGSLLH